MQAVMDRTPLPSFPIVISLFQRFRFLPSAQYVLLLLRAFQLSDSTILHFRQSKVRPFIRIRPRVNDFRSTLFQAQSFGSIYVFIETRTSRSGKLLIAFSQHQS